MKSNYKIKIAWVFLLYSQLCFSQDIIIVDQNNDSLKRKCFVTIIKPVNLNLSSVIISGQHSLTIVSDTTNSNIIKINVEGRNCIKEYYNEYAINQFESLDTLKLYQSCLISDYFPLIDFNQFDKWLNEPAEYDWFSKYLKENSVDFAKHKIIIEVFSASKLNRRFKRRILSQKQILAKTFMVPLKSIKIVFTGSHFATRDIDLFFPGSLVDENFINSQNSENMKTMASKFKCVGSVSIR
jgi:hypothetical protein